MTRPLAPLSRHLLTRSDLAQLGIQAGRILTWLAKGWLDQVGNLPGDDTVGDPVFAVTTRELRDELAQQLRSIGKDTVVFSPMRVRSLLLRAMLPVRGDAPAVDLAQHPTTMPDEPAPASAPIHDPVTEALLDPAVTGALQLAAEDLEEEVAKVLELAREEANQEALERAAELAAATHAEATQLEPVSESEAPWHEDDGDDVDEGEDEGEFFDAADLAAELGLLPPSTDVAPTPSAAPAAPDQPVEPNEPDVAAAGDDAVITAAEPAPAADDAAAPTDAVAPSEPSPTPEPEVASEPAMAVAELRESEATDAPAPEPGLEAALQAEPEPQPEPAPVAEATEPAPAADAPNPVIAEAVAAHADAERAAEVAAVPAPAEAPPEPGPAPHEEPPELPSMSTPSASHEDVMPTTPGTEAPLPASALDDLLADPPAVAAPSTELAEAADQAPFVETLMAQEVNAEPAPAPVEAPVEVAPAIAAAVETPAETVETVNAPPEPIAELPVETALAVTPVPAKAGPTDEPPAAVPELVPEQVTAAAMQRVDSFLGELRHVLVELANRPQPQPAPIDVQPLVAAVQQGFVHAGEQAKATDSALASLTTRLGEFGEKVEHGVALAVHAALGPRTQIAQTVPALIAAPSYVVAKTERSTIALFAIGFLLLCWTAIFWFKTGNTKVAVSTLVGANVVGCCLLLGRNRTS